jgi:hypothetical protein
MWTRVGGALALLLLAIVWSAGVGSAPVSASEALGNLNLRVRLLDVDHGRGQGPEMKGAARIEVVLTVATETQNIRLSVEKPDGSSWMIGGHAFTPEPVPWRNADGTEPPVAAGGRRTLAARGVLRSTFTIPLEGAAVHEIILRATGLMREGPVTTEAMVLAPLGVDFDHRAERDAQVKP